MLCIPFGFIGAVAGHIIMGHSLSILSLFGIVAMADVVVNDALMLIDFANRLVRGDMPVKNAVRAAGIQRFRPIIFTCGGLAPIITITEISFQAQYLIPMAISLEFGIFFATLITLGLCLVFTWYWKTSNAVNRHQQCRVKMGAAGASPSCFQYLVSSFL
ncbi:efflux RND transporter permease subunit [uncultured Desulfobacter sp.]|uniref:efflux RND transporter permease subunit n=1 Tax=uncultured Desulfobacter sp. TaxID=240139 RepID=UPI002AA6A3BF|nr:efflux RND transporter permease subunit [uncultured Desulfobacter sp.]